MIFMQLFTCVILKGWKEALHTFEKLSLNCWIFSTLHTTGSSRSWSNDLRVKLDFECWFGCGNYSFSSLEHSVYSLNLKTNRCQLYFLSLLLDGTLWEWMECHPTSMRINIIDNAWLLGSKYIHYIQLNPKMFSTSKSTIKIKF